MNYFKKRRNSYFPEIKDFSDPQNQWRNEKAYKLDHWHWFWFHPTAFQLLYFGRFPASIALYTVLMIYMLFSSGVTLGFMILAVLQVVLITGWIKNKKFQEMYKQSRYSFYDLWVRDPEIKKVDENEK